MTDELVGAYSRFAHFLQRAGFSPAPWSLTINSSGQERGVRATHDITIPRPTSLTTPPSHPPIISIPASLLITPERVRSSSFARSLLSADGLASLSAEQLLILWLVYQRRQGEHSSAHSYLSLLPTYYSSFEWWTEAEAALLPRSADNTAVRDKETDGEAAGQDDPVYYHRTLCSRIRTQWQKLNALLCTQHPSLQPCEHDQPLTLHSLPLTVRHNGLRPFAHPLCPSTSRPLSCLISLAEYQWAYSTVSTRSCYWPEEGGSCCLIPFLDMLNHSAHIVCSCHYNPVTRLYSLYTQHKSTDTVSPLLTVSRGSEVYISYGALSNWQLLVRYGFVLDENVDEKDEMSVEWLESFIQRRCDTKDRRQPSQPQVQSVRTAQSTARAFSSVRCCCGRSLLWQSLVSLRPCVGASARLCHVARVSSKHAKLLSLCGLYSPSSFSLTCCAATWDLVTYIKCRTVPLPPPAAPQQPTTDTLQRWADAILNDEWVDEQHERRGRELLAAVIVERMSRGGQADSNTSLLEQMEELAAWKIKQEATEDGGHGEREKRVENESCETGEESVAVSVLCRVLSGQFRVARRRMLLGALQQQLDAIQRLCAVS